MYYLILNFFLNEFYYKQGYFRMQSELDSWAEPVVESVAAAHPAYCVAKIKREIPDMAEYMGRQPEFVDCVDFTPLIEPFTDVNVSEYRPMNNGKNHGRQLVSDLPPTRSPPTEMLESGNESLRPELEQRAESVVDLEDCWDQAEPCPREPMQRRYISSSESDILLSEDEVMSVSSSDESIVVIIPKRKIKQRIGDHPLKRRKWLKKVINYTRNNYVKCAEGGTASTSKGPCCCCGAKNFEQAKNQSFQRPKRRRIIPIVAPETMEQLVQQVLLHVHVLSLITVHLFICANFVSFLSIRSQMLFPKKHYYCNNIYCCCNAVNSNY